MKPCETKERGMLFTDEMVRAILDGRKTQTRRPIKWKQTRYTEIGERDDGSYWPWSEDSENSCDYWHPCPFGKVGDRIYVRETFGECGERLVYRADIDNGANCKVRRWTPSIHMPRWASRITLEITGVHVERVAQISNDDAKAEGVIAEDCIIGYRYDVGFLRLWDSIYGDGSWKENPWVWVITFKRVDE